ncbi:MAG: ATP-binding protein, partial [Desulfurivibrionaceae bacterium]
TTPYLNPKGVLLGYIHFFKDITDWKMLETQIRQNEKMEAIGTLAGGIAHDFNNILGAIYGFTELALLDSQPDTNLRDSLNQIRHAADRAKDLVGQLLTFSRESEIHQQPLQLFPIVKETIKLLRASLPSTIEIHRNIETGPEKVMADPAQIHQLIMNLGTNAVQAMEDEGGRIEIILQAVALGRDDCHNLPDLSPGKHILLSVSDSGKGMEKEVVDRIFAPFFTTREKGQGTGMGLTVVHGIVTGNNGAINVESEPGKGTTFRIYFPVVEDGASKPEKPAIANLPTGDERIIYVDDETEVVSMARRLLEYLGYEVTTFTDSEEALKAFRQAPEDYDLLITDQIMPRLTGDELSRRVLEIRPNLPVVLCTGYREKISETEMKNIGLKTIIYKPLTLQQLGNTVRNVIDCRHY